MIAIDPNLWLFSRLALGRGWKPIVLLVAGVAVGAALWLRVWSMPILLPVRTTADPGFLFLAYLLLCAGPILSVARLLDLENGGLLDLTRLSGQQIPRVLAMVLVGTSWPYVFASAVCIGLHSRIDGDPWSAIVAAFLLGAAVGAALLTYWALPAAMVTDSAFLMPLLGILAFVALNFLQMVTWIQQRQLDHPRARATMATIALVLPVAWWLACRRLRRPRVLARRGATDLFDTVSRVIPRVGPPEFLRHLRCTVLSGGTLATLLLAPTIVIVVALRTSDVRSDLRNVALMAMPFFVALIGPFAMLSSARRAIETRTIDLARITPQRAVSVVVGWWAGVSMPYWIATVLALGALAVVGVLRLPPAGARAGAVVFVSVLALIAFAFPAIALAERLHRRRTGAYLVTLLFMALPVLMYATTREEVPTSLIMSIRGNPRPSLADFESFRFAEDNRMRALPDLEWRHGAWDGTHYMWRRQTVAPQFIPLLVFLLTILPLAAAAGRFERAHGPSFAGGAVLGAVAAVALILGALPLMAMPRSAAALLVVLAVFVAEERVIRTPQWQRLAIACGFTLIAVAFLVRTSGISWSGTLATAAGAAATLAIGMLGHELWWQKPVVSPALRAAVFVLVLRLFWFVPDLVDPRTRSSQAGRWIDLSPALTSVEVSVLVAAAAALAVAQTLIRRRAVARTAPEAR